MKTKKMSKKLVFTKKTVANLGNHEMDNALGGTVYTTATECETVCATNCIPACRSHYSICCETYDCGPTIIEAGCYIVIGSGVWANCRP
jgi:hypothetical protein